VRKKKPRTSLKLPNFLEEEKEKLEGEIRREGEEAKRDLFLPEKREEGRKD